MINEIIVNRFWEKVIKTKSCWVWSGYVDDAPNGYGGVFLKGKRYAAHRISWEIHYGPIKNGLCVCHKCDNPPCTNPLHLFLATNKENQKDCFLKGRRASGLNNGKYTRPDRTPRGEKHGKAKLTEKDIKEIRRLGSKMSQTALGHKFNTSQVNIGSILNNKTWKHI